MLWGRRAGKDESGRPRKIPGLVQMGLVIGDLVEVEDWNEYGELKQHVKIVAVSGPGANPAIKAKPPVANNENKKPAVAPAAPPAVTKKPVESNPPAGAAETTITLAMRQVSQAAAQKAKDNKKVATKTPVVAAKPEPKASSQPLQTKTKPADEKHDFETITLLQDPGTSTWSARPATQLKLDTKEETMRKLESLQSPTSTAWKSKDGGAAKAAPVEEEDDSSEEDSEEDSEEESEE
ncbi:Thioredoxin-like fold protein [Rutstroemia sp. NJR-2017a BVV2]|nr:Thioredoxin-like fold protein [Rutstroemia sp. NJR-2017a BVV2]PQE18511.1 Thioredoxin-like fold protein [Rutstroemia sp. NJR-2017a BVV2]